MRLLLYWLAYVCPGQSRGDAARQRRDGHYTVVVVTEGKQPPGLAYITPYAATSIAEYFMQAGRDVLIVYDDLTQHARGDSR